MFRVPSRPFDPTGTLEQNRMAGEVVPLAQLNQYVFIPSLMTFYTDTLVIRHDNRLLYRNVDYGILLLHKKATEDTRRECAVAVQIYDRSLDKIEIDYQAVGGQYQEVVSVLQGIKQNTKVQLINPIKWGQLLNKPATFNAASHWHNVDDFAGWERAIPSLSKIFHGVMYKKEKKYKDLFDYIDGKFADVDAYQLNVNSDIPSKVNDFSAKSRYPIGFILASSKRIDNFPEGQWVELPGNVVLYGINDNASLGIQNFQLNKDISYPQPDNILFTEDGNPIVTDVKEWIYLDNEFPVYPKSDDNDNYENINETFTATGTKFYVKVGHSGDISYDFWVNKPSINEGEQVIFTIHTVGVAQGTTFNYQLSGVNTQTVDVPLQGTMTIGSDGNAYLTVTLQPNAPRTGTNKLSCSVNVNGTIVKSCQYNLNSNLQDSLGIQILDGYGGETVNQIVYGDNFYIRLLHPIVNENKLTVTSNLFSQVAYSIAGNAVQQTNDHSIDLTIDPNTGETGFFAKLSASTDYSRQDNVVFTVKSPTATAQSQPVSAIPVSINGYFIDPTTNQKITSVNWNQPFKLVLTQDGTSTVKCPVQLKQSPSSGYLDIQSIPDIYVDWRGQGSSTTLRLNSPTTPVADQLAFAVTDPYDSSHVLNFTLNVNSGVNQ